jgi:hypothetical protein
MAPEGLLVPKAWRDRANTIGYLSGGTEAQVAVLRQVLTQLPCKSESTITWQKPDGEEITAICGELCRSQLSASGLVERATNDQWVPGEFAAEWLQNNDPVFLAIHLHVNVKFFGELLAAITADTTQADLLEVAKTSYGMSWSTGDQVHRRTGWLRSLGMAELWGQKVVRTPAGELLLSKLTLCSPDEALGIHVNERSSGIEESDVLDLSGIPGIDQEDLRSRRSLIGYIPRGINSANLDVENSALTPIAAVRKLVDILDAGTAVEEYRDLCGQELGISKSSFNTTLHTLRHMGLIEQTSYNFFAPTRDACELVSIGHERALVAYLHARYTFFGEILTHLDSPSSPSQLVKIAKEGYGYTQASNGEIRLRLGFLQDAGLVDRVDWQRFRITGVGRRFASLLAMQQELAIGGNGIQEPSAEDQPDVSHLLFRIVDDLKKFGTNGTESKAFESTVSQAFRFLGFHTEHLGGPGQTDVLCLAELAPGDRYRIIVDAKCSSNGIIGESGVNFEILRDHKRKHKADHVVVTGPDFANRLKDWAVENGVVLLQAGDLATILERHSVNPISLIDLRDTFTRVDTHKDEIFERYQLLERRSSLISRIVELAVQEAIDEDPIAAGFMSQENITYVLRKEFTPRPSVDEIKELLDFLSNPIVAALEESKDRYKLADSPHNISLRLRGFGASLNTGK